jgi:phage terminase Nu1 subunit (DNA packaging protein)
MIPEETVDTADVAGFLLLSPQRVRQLAAEGVLEKATDSSGEPLRGRFNLLSTVNSYIRYLRSKLAGRAGTADEYTQARARRMSALADIEQLRLKRIHGKLHRTEDVEFCLTQMITACRQRLLALPSRLCHSLQAKTNPAEIAEILRVEIYAALNELSEYDPAKFEAATEEYLARTGVAKPEPEADQNGTSGPDVEEGT